MVIRIQDNTQLGRKKEQKFSDSTEEKLGTERYNVLQDGRPNNQLTNQPTNQPTNQITK
jgi:hypothetical protein